MGRAPCCDKNGLKKGPWTPEEDLKLINYIQIHGPGNWRTLPKNAELQRCGKSCRLRWTNYLRPDIKRGRFSFEEEETIIQLHSILGNKWSAIAARLPGRTDNEIKNYWNTHIRKRLLRNGIDPVTHSPRLDLLDLSSILSSALCNQSLLSFSNLVGTQALLNPEVLRLVNTLISPKQENPEVLLQYLHQNQLLNPQISNPNGQNQQFQIPSDQTQVMQTNVHMPNFTPPNLQENMMPSSHLSNNEAYVSQSNQVNSCLNPTAPALFENLSLEQFPDIKQNFSFDSVISTPLSSSPTPLNSSSTFINSSSAEDERESYCSSLLKFEIPESLDFDEFM